MTDPMPPRFDTSKVTRRAVLQAGAMGLLTAGGIPSTAFPAAAAQADKCVPGDKGTPDTGEAAGRETRRDTIWDLHCHLSGVDGKTPEERMSQLLVYADRMGIERLCVYMGIPWAREPSAEKLRLENDQVLQALEGHHDRAFGFAYVSGQHVDASVAEIDRCVRGGPMVGIKLWMAKKCDAAELDPIIERAAALQAVIFQHTWFKSDGTTYPGESSPYDLVELAKRHPGVPLICGHTGGNWELGIRAIRDIPAISIDLAGSDPTNGMVEMAVRELGPERIIYGSDSGGRSFASQLAKVYGADLSDDARRLILAGNLRRMLTPILQEKKVKV